MNDSTPNHDHRHGLSFLKRWGLRVGGLVLLSAVALVAQANTLKLKPQVVVTGDALLKDIAVLEGEGIRGHADLRVAEFTGKPGTQTLRLRELSQTLRQAGVPLSQLRILGARACRIQFKAIETQPDPQSDLATSATTPNTAQTSQANARQTLPGAYRVHDVLVDMIAQALQAPPEDLMVKASGFGAQVLQQNVEDPRAYRMVWAGPYTPGKTNISLQRVDGQQVVESMPLPLNIQQRVMALCPKDDRMLKTGDRISQRSLETRSIWIDFDPQELVTESTDYHGQTLIRPLLAGKALQTKHLPKPIAVRRGDVVELRYQVGELLISVPARALGQAAIGERTAFNTLGNRRVRQQRQSVYAVVVSPSIATVQALPSVLNSSVASSKNNQPGRPQ